MAVFLSLFYLFVQFSCNVFPVNNLLYQRLISTLIFVFLLTHAATVIMGIIVSFITTFMLLATVARAQVCDQHLDLVFGQKYFIFNPSYPSDYTSETHCFWTLRTAAGTKVLLSCNLNMPSTPHCNTDRLSVGRSGGRQFSNIYCGSESFSLVSTGTDMSIALDTVPNSQGGKFVCSATAIKDINNPTPEKQVTSCDCGWTQITRIVGGVETGLHEFPYMAALIYSNIQFCGASIISDRFSLTAGHCVAKKDPASMYLLVGDHDISTGSDTAESALYKVDAYEIHPRFNDSNLKNDIAILRTQNRIIFSDYVGPVCLPFRYTYASFDGQPAMLIGWGQTEFTGPKSDILLKTTVNVISNNHCNSELAETTIQGDICTYSYANNRGDACQNDSGGPVLWFDIANQRYIIIGIISHGLACASASPSVNIRVSEYLQWIISRTGNGYCIK